MVQLILQRTVICMIEHCLAHLRCTRISMNSRPWLSQRMNAVCVTSYNSLTGQGRVSGWITCSPFHSKFAFSMLRWVWDSWNDSSDKKKSPWIEGQLTKLTWEPFRYQGQLRSGRRTANTHLFPMVVAEWRLRGRGATPLRLGLFHVSVSAEKERRLPLLDQIPFNSRTWTKGALTNLRTAFLSTKIPQGPSNLLP